MMYTYLHMNFPLTSCRQPKAWMYLEVKKCPDLVYIYLFIWSWNSYVFILYSFLKHLKVAGIQCIKCEVCAFVSEAVPVNEGQNEWVEVCRSCRGEQTMNTLQSFWGGPSSFVGAVKQLSGLTVGSWREGLVHNWKLSLEMSHVAVHLNFKLGDPCGRSACRDLTVPINRKFNIFVNRESPVGDLFIFNKGNVGQFQYENMPQADLSTSLKSHSLKE